MLVGNQYENELAAATTSTGSLLSVDFGFDATRVRVWNDGTVPLRATVESSVASCTDALVRPGADAEWGGIRTHSFGLYTTSTSTDGVDIRQARVLATGG